MNVDNFNKVKEDTDKNISTGGPKHSSSELSQKVECQETKWLICEIKSCYL